MSKLTLHKSLYEFLYRNKFISIGAGFGAAVIMLTSAAGCTYKDNNNISITDTKKLNQDQEFLKQHILEYITNIEVYKNENIGGYYIHEQLYEEAQGFIKNENGEIVETDKIFIGYNQFFITFEEAELMEVTDLLEARVLWEFKIK